MKKITFLWGLVLCLSASLSAQHLTTLEELELLEHQRSLTTIQQDNESDSGEIVNRNQSLTISTTDPEGIFSSAPANQNRDAMADIIPTAGAAETFTPDVGDFFFDPGGPGGGPDGTPGNYPNCGCLTETTLAGVTEIEFLDYEVFGNFDWLRLYDGPDSSGTVLFDNSSTGANNGANTFAALLAANGGSGVFTGTSGDFFFEFFATTVVNRLGWEVEILATGGGGGACTPNNITTAFTAGNSFAGNMFDMTASGSDDVEIEKFDINIGAGSANISVFSRPGSYVGFENDPAGWTLMGSEVVTGLGENVPTELNVGGLVIPEGETYGIYITVTDYPSVSIFYTNGDNTYTDGVVTIETGVGKGNPDFTGSTFASRSWNGTVYYCSGDTGGGGGDCDTPELEINQDISDTCMANINQTDLAQSFVPLSDTSAGAGIRFETASNGEDLILSIWDNLPNAGGTELATGTTTTSGDLWVDVFWDPVTVNPGDTYYLVIEGTVTACVSGSVNNPYPDGNVFANPGYQPFPAFDYTFRTYTCDEGGPSNNWECDDAIALSCGDVSTGTTAGATNSGGNGSPDVFYSYTGSGDPEYVTISLCDGGTTYDSLLRVFESCGDLSLGSEIALNDDFCGLQSQLTFESDGVSTYIIMVEGFGSASGNYSLAITCELAPVLGCGGQFVDSGGPNGDYSNNEDIIWTITPDEVDDFVTVIFTEFDVEATWDALYVFDGPDTSSPLISSGNPPTGTGFPAGGYYGTTIPGPFASTHPSGALTFQFLSDGSVTRSGWVADIVCAPVPPPNDLIENAISVTAETQPYTDPAVRLQYATNELLNPDGCAIAGTPGVWYSFTAEIDGTAEASITDPAGASFVIFYEAPSEDVGDETDLSFSPEPDNQCGPSTASTITTVAGQSYYIFVLNNGGPSDVVIDISGSLLSTIDNSIEGFTFYPNPTMDILNLRSNITIDNVELFNMLGQKVISQVIGATTSQVDVSGLATGTYLMKVSAEGQTASYQVIKK